MEKDFWESVREIAEAQRKLPREIRALADVPSTPIHTERLAARRARAIADGEATKSDPVSE